MTSISSLIAPLTALKVLPAGGGSGTGGGGTTPTNPPTGNGTYLYQGGAVSWLSGYSFRVSPAIYFITGTQYTSPQTDITLTAADPTLDRIDVIAVNTSGAVTTIVGTPASPPAAPAVDPTLYVELTFVYVTAASTQPAVTQEKIYIDNAEWTATATANINPNSTNNPLSGTKCIEATNAVAGNNVQLVRSSTFTITNYQQFIINLRSKATWPSAKSLQIKFANGAVQIGNTVNISSGQFGFVSSNTSSYQQIVIPLSSFAIPVGTLADRVTITIIGGGSSIGFYADNLYLESGINNTTSASLYNAGAYVSTASYATGAIVTNGGSLYVALQPSTGQTPPASVSNAYWQVWALAGVSLSAANSFTQAQRGGTAVGTITGAVTVNLGALTASSSGVTWTGSPVTANDIELTATGNVSSLTVSGGTTGAVYNIQINFAGFTAPASVSGADFGAAGLGTFTTTSGKLNLISGRWTSSSVLRAVMSAG